jgi:hypothetical protein
VPVPQPASSHVVASREIPARHFSTIPCRYANEDLLYFCSHWLASWLWNATASTRDLVSAVTADTASGMFSWRSLRGRADSRPPWRTTG